MLQINIVLFTITIVIFHSNCVNSLAHDTGFEASASANIGGNGAPIFSIPSRTITGTTFGNSIMNIGPNQLREDMIFAELQAGNIPDFMRTPIPISVTAGNDTLTYWVLPDVLCVGTNADYLRTPLNPLTARRVADIYAGNDTLTYWVLPDVLCVGTNADYLRTPLNPLTARRVADIYGAVLPTKKMAHQIWQAATVKLTPSPNGPPYDSTMMSTERMVFHNTKIQTALGNKTPGELISGHKKDVVITTGLLTYPQNVAIVGWWYPSGQMIQPLNYKSHDRFYKDYSHGIRLVNRMVTINGQWYDIYDVLRNAAVASLISDEGAFDATQMYT
ncbi:unnamed protein product [Adineta ricciae]|uniref:Uncharacterized protein n=1 Tax=Adineta ricciae TaxID=249248 RepID=A0A815P0D3_ADIRI|nr:unnamed protein product [Adineta ricciae]